MVRVELLDFQEQNPIAVEAARLLVTSFYEDSDVEAAVEGYFREAREGNYTTYGLIDEEEQLAVAASVVHGYKLKPVAYTEVEYIAVPPERQRQRQRYGSAMMRHIAVSAQLHGDTVISLHCLGSSKKFYKKLGFTESTERPNRMSIRAEMLTQSGVEQPKLNQPE